MKKTIMALAGLLLCAGPLVAQVQEIYMKITGYDNKVLTTGLSTVDDKTLPDLKNYVLVSSVQYDFEQTLNIGSQSTGAGAGKIQFNPFVITKTADPTSAPLFQAMASGMPYKFIEFVFRTTSGAATSVILYKLVLKLAAVKTMSVSSVACKTGCPGVAESVSFDYGGYVVTTYAQDATGKLSTANVAGWNRVKNIADTNPTAIIQ